MRVEILDRLTPPLQAEWEDLFSRDPEATPFSSPWWAKAWLAHWAPGAEPYLLCVRGASDLVGIAPFVRERHGPVRVLRVLGEDPSDYWEVVAEPAQRRAVAERVGAALAPGRGWDTLLVSRLPPGSGTGPALAAGGLRLRARPPVPYPCLALPGSFDDYLASLPQRRRTKLRRSLKRFETEEFAIDEVGDPEAIPDAVGRWHELRVRQWDQRGRDILGMHRESRFRELLGAALAELVPRGLALLWEVRQDGRLVGSYVNFVDSRSFYQYLGGFEPGLAHLGVGKAVITHGIRSSIERGLERYDFMLGAEPYKYEFGAEDRPSQPYACTSGSLRSRGAGALIELRRGLKERRQGLRHR